MTSDSQALRLKRVVERSPEGRSEQNLRNSGRNEVVSTMVVPTRRPAAFFDFDQTILATDSQGKEAEGLWQDFWIEGKYWMFLKMAWFVFFWINLYKCGVVGVETLNQVYISLIYRGIPLKKLEENGKHLYSSMLRALLYEKMIETMKNHHQKGHAVIVISATPDHLLLPFVEEYREIVEAMAATRLEVDECGIPTKGLVCIGAQKAAAQHRFANELLLDLSESYAYSDSHHDLEFLEAVRYRIVVNPTRQLEDIAKKRDWKILRLSQSP